MWAKFTREYTGPKKVRAVVKDTANINTNRTLHRYTSKCMHKCPHGAEFSFCFKLKKGGLTDGLRLNQV